MKVFQAKNVSFLFKMTIYEKKLKHCFSSIGLVVACQAFNVVLGFWQKQYIAEILSFSYYPILGLMRQ